MKQSIVNQLKYENGFWRASNGKLFRTQYEAYLEQVNINNPQKIQKPVKTAGKEKPQSIIKCLQYIGGRWYAVDPVSGEKFMCSSKIDAYVKQVELIENPGKSKPTPEPEPETFSISLSYNALENCEASVRPAEVAPGSTSTLFIECPEWVEYTISITGATLEGESIGKGNASIIISNPTEEININIEFVSLYYILRYVSSVELTSAWITENTDITKNNYDEVTRRGELYFNDDVTAIEDGIFGWEDDPMRTGIISLEIPYCIRIISYFGLCALPNLQNLVLPNSIVKIDDAALVGVGITSFILPKSVSILGRAPFTPSNIVNLSVDPENPYFDSRNNCNAIIDSRTNILISGNSRTVIPNTVIAIGTYAFANLSSNYVSEPLTSIEIPDGVTSIGDFAFYNCSNLTSIEIPDSVTSIGRNVFAGCTGLTSITLPDDITEIDANMFYGCSELESIIIPDNVTTIGNQAFENCTNLESVTIPDSVTTIGNRAFRNCTALTSINIPDNVTTIRYSAFQNCTNLESVTIPNSVTLIESGVFMNCSNLTSITLSNNITEIRVNTFSGCTSLTNITIPDSVTSIGNSVFENCTSLTNIEIPDSVTTIGNQAFKNCTSLTSITIPNGVTILTDYIFQNCSSLTTISLSNNITTIRYSVFNSCSSLTSIIIPNSVTEIFGGAFYNCSALTSVTCEATTPPTLGTNNFSTPNNILYVPSEALSAYQSSSTWSTAFSDIQKIK